MTESEKQEIWMSEEPLTEQGQAIADILKEMDPLEKALTIMHVLSKDDKVLGIIRARNVFELRHLIRKVMENGGVDNESIEMKLFARVLFEESELYMKEYFSKECE